MKHREVMFNIVHIDYVQRKEVLYLVTGDYCMVSLYYMYEIVVEQETAYTYMPTFPLLVTMFI